MYEIPYSMEPTDLPSVYKTRAWGSYKAPTILECIRSRVNSLVEFSELILEARKQLPPETLKTRLNKIWYKLNYHFNRIFK